MVRTSEQKQRKQVAIDRERDRILLNALQDPDTVLLMRETEERERERESPTITLVL